jgi:hypothetical protein
MKTTILCLFVVLVLSGCDSFDGPRGHQGQAGVEGVSVNTITPATSVFDPATLSLASHHTRTVYSTGTTTITQATAIVMFTGTYTDYSNAIASTDYHSLNAFLADPIENDLCGLWYWVQIGADWYLRADNALAYQAPHYPVIVSSFDANLNPNGHAGMDLCAQTCRADDKCVGAYYNAVADVPNMLICYLLLDVGTELDTDAEFEALSVQIPGFLSANMQFGGGLVGGIISVCD